MATGAAQVPVAVLVGPAVQPAPRGWVASRPLLPAALSQPPEYQAQDTPRADSAVPMLALCSSGSRLPTAVPGT
ncbi:MAG: hypothetical protein ACRDTX_20635 [Pseudonocardiaceae bacterium]